LPTPTHSPSPTGPPADTTPPRIAVVNLDSTYLIAPPCTEHTRVNFTASVFDDQTPASQLRVVLTYRGEGISGEFPMTWTGGNDYAGALADLTPPGVAVLLDVYVVATDAGGNSARSLLDNVGLGSCHDG
jgi:hypothetical protein